MIDLSKRYKTINDTIMGAWVAGAMSKAAAKIDEPPPLDAKQGGGSVSSGDPSSRRGRRGGAAAEAEGVDLTRGDVPARHRGGARRRRRPRVYAGTCSRSKGQSDRAELIVLQVERAAGRGTPQRADLERTKYSATKQTKSGAPGLYRRRRRALRAGFSSPRRSREYRTWPSPTRSNGAPSAALERVAYAPASALKAFFDGVEGRTSRQVSALPCARQTADGHLPVDASASSTKLAPAHLARFPDLTHLRLARGVSALALRRPAGTSRSFELDDFVETDGADLFRDNPKLTRLVAGKNARPDRFSGLRLRELHMRGELERSRAGSEAIPDATRGSRPPARALRCLEAGGTSSTAIRSSSAWSSRSRMARGCGAPAKWPIAGAGRGAGAALGAILRRSSRRRPEPLKGRARSSCSIRPDRVTSSRGSASSTWRSIEPAWPNIEVRELL